MLRAFRFAWLSIVRQPARTCLGILGIAATGALLLDMLLLSRGLVLSFGELLDRVGFDVRVLATEAPPFSGPQIVNATALTKLIAALPEVESVSQLMARDAEFVSHGPAAARQPAAGGDGRTSTAEPSPRRVGLIGAEARARSLWSIVEGRDLTAGDSATPALVINRSIARELRLSPGSTALLRGRCGSSIGAGETDALPPVAFTVAGIADFPFDSLNTLTAAGTVTAVARLCADVSTDRAEILLVRSASASGPDGAAAAIRAIRPDLHVVTNAELIERFSRVEFSYFRQVSVVLTTVTLFFGFLLIAVLLTVSVNQQLGQIAALRALGLSRQRVVAGVLWESVLLVGTGGILAIPLGAALSVWLENILHAMPGIPSEVRFFVFEPRALALHAGLLAVAAAFAAAYPMRIVASLPIAATLRREVIS